MTSIESDPAVRQPSAAGGKSDDRFLWGFPLFAVCMQIFLAALTYLERFGGGPVLSAFLLLILVAVAMLVIALFGVVALVRGKFRRAAAFLLAPLIIASPFLLIPVLNYEYLAFDLMRFHFTKGKYTEVIGKLSPEERATRVLFFDWGRVGLAAVTATSEYWLVYDESGEIALPDEERSQAWKDRAKKKRLTDEQCTFETNHLSGHFYSVETTCPY